MSRLLSLAALTAALADRTPVFHVQPVSIALQNAFRPLSDAERTIRMQNAYTIGNPAGVTGAMGMTTNVYEAISSKAYEVKFPELEWQKIIPVGSIDSSINVGAKLVSYRVKDWRGKAAWRSPGAQDIPRVGVGLNKVVIPIEEAAISGTVDIGDLESVAFGFEGMNLITDTGEAMRKTNEYHIEETVFFGAPKLGFAGYIDYPLVPLTTASTKAAGGTTWAVATTEEIIADIMTAIGTPFQTSKGIFLPNVVRLPYAQWMLINSRRVTGTSGDGINETIASFVSKNNFWTARNGTPLRLEGLRYLQGAGVNGTDRLIAEVDDADNHYLPMPLPFNMLPPQDRQFATDLFARWKIGSYHKPFPTSAVYMDGI